MHDSLVLYATAYGRTRSRSAQASRIADLYCPFTFHRPFPLHLTTEPNILGRIVMSDWECLKMWSLSLVILCLCMVLIGTTLKAFPHLRLRRFRLSHPHDRIEPAYFHSTPQVTSPFLNGTTSHSPPPSFRSTSTTFSLPFFNTILSFFSSSI